MENELDTGVWGQIAHATLTFPFTSVFVELMQADREQDRLTRASVFAALGNPGRLAIVDHLLLSDASPSDFQSLLAMPSNLAAHHLRVLENAGVVRRLRSQGDRRRTYLSVNADALHAITPSPLEPVSRVLFVCAHNTARSQLAVAIWRRHSPVPADSAGTRPAGDVHPGTVAAARRHTLLLRPQSPRHIDDVVAPGDLVITVCDHAHEELPAAPNRVHWSIQDPEPTGQPEAFDRTIDELANRIRRLSPRLPAVREPTVTVPPPGAVEPAAQADLTIDPALALDTAASRLRTQFGEALGADTINGFLHSSYRQFAARASIPRFLPLLAERFAAQRLEALARMEGKRRDGRPTVLFLCTHDAGCSQMALGFFSSLAGDAAVGWSGGSEPADDVDPAAVAAMAERGIDISHEYPKPWTDEIVTAADVVITLGSGDARLVAPGRRFEEWAVDDPLDRDVNAVRPVRDEIERRVRTLLADLELATSRV